MSMTNFLEPSLQQSGKCLDGSVAILWDIENCPVPSDVRPEDVAGNIRMALQIHPVIRGAVTLFSAYGDFSNFPRRLREGCQRTGVKLIDVPNGRKDAADKAILVDMFLFAMDNPPPSTIMLISGDVDFAPALHILGQRGYDMILAIPSRVGVSCALSNAGRFVWDWPTVARAEGIFSPTGSFGSSCGVSAEILRHPKRCFIGDNSDHKTVEAAIVYGGFSQSCFNSGDFSMISPPDCNTTSISAPSFEATSKLLNLPSGLSEVPVQPVPSCEQDDLMLVQPGDLNGLKARFVYIIEQSGGCLLVSRVHAEYEKYFGKPLNVSEYGTSKLRNLFKKMTDKISVGGEDHRRFIYLHNSGTPPSAPPIDLARNRKRGKRTRKDKVVDVTGTGFSSIVSDDVCVFLADSDFSMISPSGINTTSIPLCFQAMSESISLPSVLREVPVRPVPSCEQKDLTWVQAGDLNGLKAQLVYILKQCGGCLLLSLVPEEYQKNFGRRLSASEYGASELLTLLMMIAYKISVEGGRPKEVYFSL